MLENAGIYGYLRVNLYRIQVNINRKTILFENRRKN